MSGTPQLGLDIGTEERVALFWDRSFITRDADRTGMEPTVLLAYTVQEGDFESDGISIGADKLSLNDGAIWDKNDNHADPTHEAMAANASHKVDAPDETGPTVSSMAIVSDPGADGFYAIGDEIVVTVTFSEDLSLEGSPHPEMYLGGAARTAEFESSEGETMVFAYTVTEGDDSPRASPSPRTV